MENAELRMILSTREHSFSFVIPILSSGFEFSLRTIAAQQIA